MSFSEIAQEAIAAADEVSERIAGDRYRATISDVETMRNHVRKLANAIKRGWGNPHVGDLEVGDPVEARVWSPAKVTWLGDFVLYVETPDGKRHRIERFQSDVRKPK